MRPALKVLMHVGLLQALCAPSLGPSHEGPDLLKKFQFTLRLRPLIFSGSKNRIPDTRVSECWQGFTLTQTWATFPAPLSLFIWHVWGIQCADRSILLDRMVTFELQY
jgi:hypothetical protein